MYFSRQSGHVLWTAGLLSSLPFARTQKTPMENLVLADCGPSGGEMLYYPGDAWTGVGNNTNKPTMHVSLPSSQSTPWGRDNGVTANFPNGDIFTVHINPKITDPEAAGDVWHRYDLDKPLKCYSYHWDKVYQRDDGQWCSSAYVCNHRGKAYIAPFDPSSIPIWKVDPSKVKCDSSVKDESLESARRWDASGADWAFFASSLSWLKDNASLTATGLSYSQYISSKYFDGKPQFRCSDIGSNNPCTDTVQCQDTNIPAGFLILNSFVAIHNLHATAYAAIELALNEVSRHIDEFQTIFAPLKTDDNNWIKEMFNFGALYAGVGSAALWNIALKGPLKAAKNPDLYPFAKDVFNSGVSFTLATAKDFTGNIKPDDMKKALRELVMSILEPWKKAEAAMLKTLFSGTAEGLNSLALQLRNGLALNKIQSVDQEGFANDTLKLVYAAMLPLAWNESTQEVEESPNRLYPMILMDPQNCVTSGSDLNKYVDPKKSARISVCYKNLTFFVGYPTYTGFTNSRWPTDLTLWALPGGENGADDKGNGNPLSGQKWGGLTLKDLVISVFEGYRQNGYKNGWDINKIYSDPEKHGDMILGNGVREPGYVQLPICTASKVRQEARGRWWKFNEEDPSKPFEKITDTFPCGDGALTDDEMASFGF